ncbi:hypothetical protein FRC06_003590 [Ceratobasidium sp. 370]|nr:hypothetical protein FRC06_003590 [Ceratobasidium sp. 370]
MQSVDEKKHTSPSAAVVKAISETDNMIVICGPGVSVVSGMPDGMDTAVKLSHNTFERHTTLQAAIEECSATSLDAKNIDQDKLAAFNKLMAGFRKQARTAPPTNFYRFLHRVFREQRVKRCFTQNIDGLETQGYVGPQPRITMICGDNRMLRCPTKACRQVDTRHATSIDSKLLLGETVICASCSEESTRFLRPAIQARMADELLPGGSLRNAAIAAAEECELLLVVGTPLTCDDMFDLVHDIAAAVHGNYGAVVYVDPREVTGRNTRNIDFRFQLTIEEFFERVLKLMDEPSQDCATQVNLAAMTQGPSDRWYKVGELFECLQRKKNLYVH